MTKHGRGSTPIPPILSEIPWPEEKKAIIISQSREFWMSIYIAAIASGAASLEACELADDAAENYAREWSE